MAPKRTGSAQCVAIILRVEKTALNMDPFKVVFPRVSPLHTLFPLTYLLQKAPVSISFRCFASSAALTHPVPVHCPRAGLQASHPDQPDMTQAFHILKGHLPLLPLILLATSFSNPNLSELPPQVTRHRLPPPPFSLFSTQLKPTLSTANSKMTLLFLVTDVVPAQATHTVLDQSMFPQLPFQLQVVTRLIANPTQMEVSWRGSL